MAMERGTTVHTASDKNGCPEPKQISLLETNFVQWYGSKPPEDTWGKIATLSTPQTVENNPIL